MSTTYTLGKQLAETREARDLSVEDIAHQTRISAATLRCLENDDYSQFPNLMYARSFLTLYSRHLDIDASEFLDELNTHPQSSSEEGGYFNGQFNSQELQEIKSWKNYVPVRPILTTLFFIAFGVPAAWWVSTLYIEYQKEAEMEANRAPAVENAPVESGAPKSITVPGAEEVEPDPVVEGEGLVNGPDSPIIPEALKNAPRAGSVADDEPKPETGAEEGNTPAEAAVPDSEAGESPVARASGDSPL